MSTHASHAPHRRAPRTREDHAPVPPGPTPNVRHQHRERDFGIGYGNSSGYGSEQHYTRPWGPERFRCV